VRRRETRLMQHTVEVRMSTAMAWTIMCSNSEHKGRETRMSVRHEKKRLATVPEPRGSRRAILASSVPTTLRFTGCLRQYVGTQPTKIGFWVKTLESIKINSLTTS
jgi:hypothetical protein